METKAFETPILVSLVTGTLLGSFSRMHEAAEWVMGHPVWTHEMGSEALWALMRSKVLEQHPDLDVDVSGVTKDNWAPFTDDLIEQLGPYRQIVRGEEVRAADPITTAKAMLGPDKPIIALDAGKGSSGEPGEQ